MQAFHVPQRETVSTQNQANFDAIQGKLGFVPNLYAAMAYSENALSNYLQLQSGKTSLTNKEKEVVNLVVSQVNGCQYCLSAHTVVGKMNGFTDEQVLEIRSGAASFSPKLDALARLTQEITQQQGRPDEATLETFFAAGYTSGTLVDVIVAIADKVVMNYLHNITQVPIDFPLAPALNSVPA